MRHAMLSLLLWVASAAQAQQWVLVDGRAPDAKAVVEVDASSVTRDGVRLKAWVRKTYADEVILQDSPRIAFRREMSLEVVDCAARSMAPKLILVYGTTTDTAPLQHVETSDTDLRLRDVIPGSVGERQMTFICKFKSHV